MRRTTFGPSTAASSSTLCIHCFIFIVFRHHALGRGVDEHQAARPCCFYKKIIKAKYSQRHLARRLTVAVVNSRTRATRCRHWRCVRIAPAESSRRSARAPAPRRRVSDGAIRAGRSPRRRPPAPGDRLVPPSLDATPRSRRRISTRRRAASRVPSAPGP